MTWRLFNNKHLVKSRAWTQDICDSDCKGSGQDPHSRQLCTLMACSMGAWHFFVENEIRQMTWSRCSNHLIVIKRHQAFNEIMLRNPYVCNIPSAQKRLDDNEDMMISNSQHLAHFRCFCFNIPLSKDVLHCAELYSLIDFHPSDPAAKLLSPFYRWEH